jgi:hypothetical protein
MVLFYLSWIKTLWLCVKRVKMSWYESDLSSNHRSIYRVVLDEI